MDKKTYLSTLAALATVIAIGLLVLLAVPIIEPVAWALIIGIATMPHFHRLLKRFPNRPGRAAGLMVLAVTVCFILPTAALVMTAAVNAPEWYRQVEQLVATITRTGTTTLSQIPQVGKIMSLIDSFGIDLAGIGGKIAAGSSSFILAAATNIAKNLFDFLFTLAVALFILYFIYRDGDRVVSVCIGRLAPNPRKAQQYASQIRSITTAVTVGTILTCVTQGVIAGLGYWVAGVPAPIFCGTLTAIAALIPVVGTALIWVPLAGIIALNGSYMTALLLAAWCIVFVGLSDNAIRPLAIGAASDISILAVVLGAICGVILMGLLGLILGPVIFAILFNMWDDVVSEVDAAEQADYP
ncbi:MAG TPA: AI-2E family transporter [Geobacter sp.]|nr:AI-2E family transporter [Geobacter sp.]